jgi:hypothetical protein
MTSAGLALYNVVGKSGEPRELRTIKTQPPRSQEGLAEFFGFGRHQRNIPHADYHGPSQDRTFCIWI